MLIDELIGLIKNYPNAVFSKVPNGKQLSCQKADQNEEKNQSYETFHRDLNFVEDLN